ncbi:MAG: hypothetical protein R2729_17060 [Bryobacteraceae bacterium]
MRPLIAAFESLLKTLGRVQAKNVAQRIAATGGMAACGPACAFFAGTLAGLVLDNLFEASDAEQRAADTEARMKKALLELDFQKGLRRLEELNAMRAGRSSASMDEARHLITEARSYFLNASSSGDLPLLAVRSDCYVGSCNALLIQADLHNYERAYATCARLEAEYVNNPPGWALSKPNRLSSVFSGNRARCAIYSRRVFLYGARASALSFTEAYARPVELYEHMGPVSALLRKRGSRLPGLLPAEGYGYDRYLNLYAEAHEKSMNCPPAGK